MLNALIVLPLFCSELAIPVAEDASVIKQSLAISNAADQNFGSSDELTIGNYHVTAEGLLKFSLALPAATNVEKAELVLQSPRIVGSWPSAFVISKVSPEWSEDTVTWNSKPLEFDTLGEVLIGTEDVHFDVTQAVKESLAAAETQVSFKISSKSSTPASLFLSSKEKTAGASLLKIRY